MTDQVNEAVAWTDDAQKWGKALNEASWTFIETCPEKSPLLFNTAKGALRAAILRYAEFVAAVNPALAHPSRGVVDEAIDERASFEADYLRRFNAPGRLGMNAEGRYGHLMTRCRFEGWQARAALQAAQPAALSPLPLPERLAREADCTDEAARQFYAEGWNACLAAQPAVPSVPDSVTLTVAQIADLAAFAGLTLAAVPELGEDERAAEITVCACPDKGVLLDGEDTDPGLVAHYTHIAYYSEYPDEGCIGLGPEIAAAPKDQPAQGVDGG